MENELKRLYRQATGTDTDTVVLLPGAGSNRRYYMVGECPVLIGTVGDDIDENKAFIYLSGHFAGKGLDVPHVRAVSDDCRVYLQDYLGDTSLYDLIDSRRNTPEWDTTVVPLLEKTMKKLPDLQWLGADGLDFGKCYPVAAMDRRSVMWDLNYFKYCFLKQSGLEFSEDRLEDDLEKLCDIILSFSGNTFMYRDFQSRNVMIKDGEPWFIDFQGGRRGPCHYDVVSFLWQARAQFTDDLRQKLVDTYIESASRYTAIDPVRFRYELRYFVLFRTLQVLGAYGFRGYTEKKAMFLKSIPAAIENLRQVLREPFVELPYLCALLDRLMNLPRYSASDSNVLTVRVSSFGYKRHGIPSDPSGNGGGFVFDCRAIHNPGRYDEYKQLTGRDREVIDFLEKDGEIIRFLDCVYGIVDPAVATYLRRGFTNLMVSFGCTGGRHRSVYSAEALTRHLHERFPQVKLILNHYEQNIETIISPEQ